MLYRKAKQKIENFMSDSIYKSLLVVGVRQCGKTTLLKGMFKDSNMIYCNLEEQEEISRIFDGNLIPERLISEIELLTNTYFDENETKILILDEIQTNPRAITSLKYFDESNLNIRVIGSGSLLGVKLNDSNLSFPVGKVDIINMYPLDFEEFLINMKMDRHVEKIRECFTNNTMMPKEVHNLLIETFMTFLEVGSHPQAVVAYISGSRNQVEKIQTNLNLSYMNDAAKYIDNKDKVYVSQILDNLGDQLLKENQKFKIASLKSGLKYNAVENAFAWLSNTDITYKAYILGNKKVKLPLKSNVVPNRFKLFYCDTALLLNKMNYSLRQIKPIDNIYVGLVIENYIATELYKKSNGQLYTYNDNSKEIDFLIERDNMLIPIEVKAALNTKSKSLKTFMEVNDTSLAYRISQKNFGYDNNIKSIPLYATFLV